MSINIINLTFIECKSQSFYISQSPSNENINQFITSIKKKNIKHVIRLCKSTYDFTLIENEKIKFYDIEIPDGSVPNKEIIIKWNNIIDSINKSDSVLVHCIAGLGRSPLMVAISLINENMDPYDVVNLIRKQNPKSFNSKQLNFLVNYKSNKKNKFNFFSYLICK